MKMARSRVRSEFCEEKEFDETGPEAGDIAVSKLDRWDGKQRKGAHKQPVDDQETGEQT